METAHHGNARQVHVHADKGADRMVASFVGSPETVVEGALNAAVVVQRTVDMRYHKGEWWRGDDPRILSRIIIPF